MLLRLFQSCFPQALLSALVAFSHEIAMVLAHVVAHHCLRLESLGALEASAGESDRTLFTDFLVLFRALLTKAVLFTVHAMHRRT